jgi:hypothetical protein
MKTMTLGLALVIFGGMLMMPLLVRPAPVSAHSPGPLTHRPS